MEEDLQKLLKRLIVAADARGALAAMNDYGIGMREVTTLELDAQKRHIEWLEHRVLDLFARKQYTIDALDRMLEKAAGED